MIKNKIIQQADTFSYLGFYVLMQCNETDSTHY